MLEVLHQTTTHVVLAVPFDFLTGLGVKDQTEGSLVLPHLASDVVTVTQFIGETVTIGVQKDTTDTTEGFSGQELDLCIRFIGVDETGRVDLDLVHVDGVGTSLKGELNTVTSAVVTVGGGQVVDFGSEYLMANVLMYVKKLFFPQQ
jgi:hypothetical protein